MKKYIMLVILILLTSSLIFYFVNQDKVKAVLYIHNKGYKILNYVGSTYEYTLDNNLLANPFSKEMWQFQKGVDYTKLIGKKYDYLVYNVKNHRLDNYSPNRFSKSLGKTKIVVLLIDHKIIGGVSSYATPHYNNDDWGLVFIRDIDGRTIDEVYPNYKEFDIKWMKKYCKNPEYFEEDINFSNNKNN